MFFRSRWDNPDEGINFLKIKKRKKEMKRARGLFLAFFFDSAELARLG
jgi:hypothetical protein